MQLLSVTLAPVWIRPLNTCYDYAKPNLPDIHLLFLAAKHLLEFIPLEPDWHLYGKL